MKEDRDNAEVKIISVIRKFMVMALGLLLFTISFFCLIYFNPTIFSTPPVEASLNQTSFSSTTELWQSPNINSISNDDAGREIRYGRELITNTASYLGPTGSVMAISNGMNCQNCHLEGGTQPYGFNFSAVASTYPKFKPRSGTLETIQRRVNDCLERSLNGKALLAESPEMKAIVAYIQWVGSAVPKGVTPVGAGLMPLPFLDRAADPVRGKPVYDLHCASCHGLNGEGLRNVADATTWKNPPLWGSESYNDGAGLFRLSLFAGYIKNNMPQGVSWQAPLLSDEEAWDIAAYVNSMPRPKKDITKDWPDISKKPVDHPFGKFADDFSEEQHKYGPFKPIEEARLKMNKTEKK